MKKLIALVLALAMVATLGLAFAADDLTITIADTHEGQIYKIYKLFDATVTAEHTSGGTGISYQLPDGKSLEGNTWFKLDEGGNVVAKEGTDETAIKSDAFKTWAVSFGTELTDKQVTGDGTDKTISGLANGYYYITTTTGTLVTVTSIGPSIEVVDKNPGTEIDKEITGVADGDVTADKEKALAQVGTVVNFEATIPIANGAVNYIFEDKMSHGLTLGDTVTVKLLDGETLSGAIAEATYGTLTAANKTDDAELDIRIVFSNEWLKANIGKTIVINYTGTVNSNAVIADAANPNKATIKWGNVDNPLTDEDEVEVWSAKITVKKVDGDGKPLEGAGFILKNASNKYYKNTDGIVSWVDAEDDATEIFPVKATADATEAAASFTGLANGTYTLIEKTVPTGYNKAADSTVTIKDADAEDLNLAVETTVTNNSGAELPSTGGIGTTIFYILGGLLVIGAAVILVARRKAQD